MNSTQTNHSATEDVTISIDKKSTARARAHLDRLATSNGKRIVVDIDAVEREALEFLIAAGYESSQSGVIRKAITDAAKRKRK